MAPKCKSAVDRIYGEADQSEQANRPKQKSASSSAKFHYTL